MANNDPIGSENCQKCGCKLAEVRIGGKPLEQKLCFACAPTAGRCPICGERLRTLRAQQCQDCGASWHSSPPAYTNDYKTYSQAVRENAKWVNLVLVCGTTVGATIVALKLAGVARYRWGDVNIPTDDAWLLVLIFTIANLYVTFLLINSIRKLSEFQDHDTNRAIFDELSTTGGLFVRGLVPRTESRTVFSGVRVYKMHWRDPTTWLALATAALIPLAVIPFSWSVPGGFWRYVGLALSLVWINWKLAASWIVSMSLLAVPAGECRYLDRMGWLNSVLSLNTWVAIQGPLYAVVWMCYSFFIFGILALIVSSVWSTIRRLVERFM